MRRRWRTRLPGLVLWLLALGGAALAQDADPADEPARELKTGKVVHAFRITAARPALDGRLNDEVWMQAESTTGFIQRDPDNGVPMTEATRLQVAYDERYLYVAVTCADSDALHIATVLSRRDDFPASDYVGIALDPRHDHLTGYGFETNPSGVQRDFVISDDDNFDFDHNAIWEVRTSIDETGWRAEFRIPFSQMRFTASPDPGQIWGLNPRRQIQRHNELGTWVAKPRDAKGEASLFGHLVFDQPIVTPRRLEFMPYLLGSVEHLPGAAGDRDVAAGIDTRLGLGQGATLAATVNPDFGQVEQDPAVLNLSVFETFFPEKRVFFLEDSRTFVPPYGLFQLFHSRRIGAQEATILGAAKVTGKRGDWTYGGLSAVTAHDHSTASPTTSFNVARLQRDVLDGSSNVGLLMTGVFRNGADDAVTGGGDFKLRWDDNRTEWNGHWALTRAPGGNGVQTSGGGVTNFSFSRKHWNAGSHFDHFGRDFRVTDLGFFRARANRYATDGNAAIEQPDPWKIFRNLWLGTNLGQQWNGEHLVVGRYTNVNGRVEFRNYWSVAAGGGHGYQVFDDLDTRGGPPIVRPPNTYNYLNVGSDSRRSWRVEFGGDRGITPVGSHNASVFTNLSLQPLRQLQLSMSARYERGVDNAQWIENLDIDGDRHVDNVYGTLRRNVLDLTLRGTYAFSPDFTIQAYLQPFVAAGAYDNIRLLARPGSYEFLPAVIPSNPDFNNKSVRGNVVLRWEYVRGSTIYVVWNLAKSDATHPGDFRGFRDVGSAFGADASHVFLVKATYWLNR
jgi:hypothetical protein